MHHITLGLSTNTLIALGIALVFVFGALILGVLAVKIYNKLVTLKNRYENGFSQIEVQLQRRHDLIPNLVETAKGYLSHERETLEGGDHRSQPSRCRPETGVWAHR